MRLKHGLAAGAGGMINLLPTDLKEERKFGRFNQLIIKLLIGIALISIFATIVMLSGLQLTKADQKFLEDSIAIKTTAYSEVKPFEEQSNKLKTKISNIEKLFEREVMFSKLLVDIASSIPVGAQLTDLSLTGTSTEPLQITANVNNQELAGVLRKNLVDSGIFESADIQSVILEAGSDTEEEHYAVSLTASLAGSGEKIRVKAAAEAKAAEAKKAAAAAAAESDK